LGGGSVVVLVVVGVGDGWVVGVGVGSVVGVGTGRGWVVGMGVAAGATVLGRVEEVGSDACVAMAGGELPELNCPDAPG
jgi:hypothetical protein